MPGYTILTTRKRVIVALVHTVVFLAVAAAGLFFRVAPLRAESPVSAWILAGVYLTVSAILLWLTAIAVNGERIYFSFCTTSAIFGLARQLLGDSQIHVAVYVRIAMLSCAVIVGMRMLNQSRQPEEGL